MTGETNIDALGNLLASIVSEKYGTHQPLNRQPDRYALEGVDLSLVDPGRLGWRVCGGARAAAQSDCGPSAVGGRPRAAAMYTLIGTARLNDIDSQAWLADN